METLLNEWGFENLIEKFKENDITTENIYLLTDDMFKELIPSVGIRVIFLQKLRSYKEIKLDVNFNNVLNEIDTNSNLSGSTNTVASANSDGWLVPQENREVSFIGIDNFFIVPILPDFDLKTLLETSPLGNSILKYYSTNSNLDHTRRSRLVDIIIKHIFNFILKHRLKHDDYNIITSKIITLFPKESPSTYYVASIPKRESYGGKPIVARGCLVDKCRNLIHRSGETPIKKRKSTSYQTLDDLPETRHKLADECHEEVQWLKLRNEPWADVISKWQHTFEIRKLANFITVEEFLREWPILRDKRADSLIQLDFDRLHPNCGIKLISDWEDFFNVVKRFKKNNLRDATLLEILASLDDALSEDSKVDTQLFLLPHLIPPKGRIHVDGKHWKFSSQEALDALIVHAKGPGDIDHEIELKCAKAKIRKITVQPYVIIQGPTLRQIVTSYIVIDKITYQQESTKQGLDLCFKCFQVLDAKYPPEAEHLYTLIQKGIYKINLKQDKIFPYIMDILENL